MFQNSFKIVSKLFQKCFKSVSKVCLKCFKVTCLHESQRSYPSTRRACLPYKGGFTEIMGVWALQQSHNLIIFSSIPWLSRSRGRGARQGPWMSKKSWARGEIYGPPLWVFFILIRQGKLADVILEHFLRPKLEVLVINLRNLYRNYSYYSEILLKQKVGTAVARDEGREYPFSVTGAIPGLIQRCQNGSEVTVVRRPSSPGIYRLIPTQVCPMTSRSFRRKYIYELWILWATLVGDGNYWWLSWDWAWQKQRRTKLELTKQVIIWMRILKKNISFKESPSISTISNYFLLPSFVRRIFN